MEKRRNIFTIVFLAVATLVIAGLAFFASRTIQSQEPIKTDLASGPTTVPAKKEETQEYPSSDGTYTLTMKNSGDVGGTVHQTFSITSEDSQEQVVIYEKDSDSGSLLSVPANTFSPNHKFIFLTYKEVGINRYIVLRTDGEDIKKDSKTVEIVSQFSEQYPDYVITDVTGWGGYALLVVNTDTKDGETGPSWWFDTTSFSFIRLSTRFN
jgi:hypothetical protein